MLPMHSLFALAWANAAVAPAMQGAWWLAAKPTETRSATRTGGPDDDDDDDELRWLMPILAVVVVLAVVFG